MIIIRRSKQMSNREFSDFLHQLGLYASTGLPFPEAIQIIKAGQETKRLKQHLGKVQDDLSHGKSLADTLSDRYPAQFKPFLASILQNAKKDETADVLLKIGEFLDSIQLNFGKVRTVLLYPLIVIFVAAMVCAILISFVIPVFEEMFASFGSALPAPTQAVILISNFFRQYAVTVFIMLVFVIAAGKQLDRKWASFNALRSRVIHRLPIIGRLHILSSTYIFLRTMIFFMEDGRPMQNALEAASQTAQKRFYRNAILAIKANVERGASLGEALEKAHIFPAQVSCIAMAIQAHTNITVPLFARLADRYLDQTQKGIKNLTAILHPLFIIIIGFIVGGLVFSMYLPIFKIGGTIGG